MTVGSILSDKGRDVVSLPPEASLDEVARELARRRIGAILICDASGQLVGIVSERDIVREVAAGGVDVMGRPVTTCMTNRVVSCTETDTVDSVMEVMTNNRFRHLPVMSNGRVVGVVSIGDVVKRKIEQAVREAEDMRSYIAAS